MPFITQGKTNWKYIFIVAVLAAITGGVVFGYQYYWGLKEEVSFQRTPSPSPTLTLTPSPIPVTPTPTPTPTPTVEPPINKKVLLLIFNPIIESRGNKRLTEVYGWNDPDILTSQYINDVKTVSGNFLNYNVVERVELDTFVRYTDGYVYDDTIYIKCWEARNCDHGDAGRGQSMMDYRDILQQYNVCQKLNAGNIDELWIFGAPYFGFWESALAGPGAFWYNSPPIMGTACNKLLPIMGFNYERGVSEMIENLGHRIEAVMTHIYGGWQRNESTAWDKFTLRDIDAPGKAQCGNVHYAPNSVSDYDWTNTRYVRSACDDWYTYPALLGNYKTINCQEWGCDGYEYKKWWLKHLPRATGVTNGKLNNWWKYVVDYENAVR